MFNIFKITKSIVFLINKLFAVVIEKPEILETKGTFYCLVNPHVKADIITGQKGALQTKQK